MKKIFWGVVAGLLLVGVVCIGRYETSIKQEGTVTKQSGFVIVVKDKTGREWKWNTDKRFEVGEKIGEDTDMWYRVSLKNKILISKEETTCYDRRNSTATKLSTNTMNWIFYRRKNDIINDQSINDGVKKSYIFMMDRYLLTCCRELRANGYKKDALNLFKKVSRKRGKRYFMSYLFCILPWFMVKNKYKK